MFRNRAFLHTDDKSYALQEKKLGLAGTQLQKIKKLVLRTG